MVAPWSAERTGEGPGQRGLRGAAGAHDAPGATGLANLTAAAWELDLTTGELDWSAGMHRLAGAVPGSVRPSMTWWVSMIVPADRARVRASLLVVRETLRGTQERFSMVGVDGVERTVHCWTEVETAPDGTPSRMFGSAVDVSGLAPGTHRDDLTGLTTRPGLRLRLADALDPPAAPGPTGVVLVGLDRFAVLTDACGRSCGDAVLVAVAGRLRALAPAGATLARLDGDVFAIALVGEDADPAAVADLAERVVSAARRPHTPTERADALTVTASVGWAVSDPREVSAALDAEELLRRATLALGRAKRDGRDRAAAYDASLTEAAQARVRTEAVLRSALDAGRLQVLYQPVIDLTSGAVAGVEALGRIVDPELGPLSPALFVGVSEETGLVTRLDEWVLGRASAMVARWRPPSPEALPAEERQPTVAVNMSSRTLSRADLTGLVTGALASSGSTPARLLVEITEHSLLDQGDVARDTLAGLQALGIGVGIDDFGTGWSALSYLSALDLAFMKIDRCFVSRLGQDTSAEAVVRTVIDLAHAHSLSVVAEGVETEEQARLLAAMGCDHGQGWWFGRPMRESDLDGAVQAWYDRAEAAGFGAWSEDGPTADATGAPDGQGPAAGSAGPRSRRLALLA